MENIRTSQLSRFSNISTDTQYIKNGHRVQELGGMMQQAPLMLKAIYEFRGNRWYALVAMYNPSKGKQSADNFFNSFQLLDYPQMEWAEQAKNKLFTTWAPTEFSLTEEDNDDDENSIYNITGNYGAYDSSRADNFNIIIQKYNKYFWCDDDSAFWKQKIAAFKTTQSDTVLSFYPVKNGDVKGSNLYCKNPVRIT